MKEIEEAIRFISPDVRDTWVEVGMAVHSAMGNSGFGIWNGWSKQAPSYSERSAIAVWRSFVLHGGITIRTLFKLAREGGYQGDAEVLTSIVEKATAEMHALREREAARDQSEKAQARRKAERIISECRNEQHAYLEGKGFAEMQGLVYYPQEGVNLLVIPMRDEQGIQSIQMIDRDGKKKFLAGGKASGCEFVFENKGPDWWCEGYATGLSLRRILSTLKVRYRIHVCFSAHNLSKMAKESGRGFVVADNDKSGAGEKAAKDSGLRYWISDRIGEDFNDKHLRVGTFQLSQEIKKWMR